MKKRQRVTRFGSRSFRRRLFVERLSSRIVLSASQFAGNDCAPDLDLSAIVVPTVEVGDTLTLNLFTAGATVTDDDSAGQPTGDAIRLILDPDIGTDTPEGISITPEGNLSWIPTQSQIGTHQIVVIAMDAGSPVLADAETFEIVVTEVTPGPPVVDLNGAADNGIDFQTTFVEDDGAVAIVDADLTVANPLGATISSAEIRLTNPLDGDSESLGVDTAGTAINAAFDTATGTLSLANTDSVGNYQQVLRSLTYLNTSQVPTTNSPRVVDITVTSDNLTSVTATATVDIVARTDPPIVDLNGTDDNGNDFQATFTEDDGAVAIVDTDLQVENPESATISSARIQLTNPLDGASESLNVDTSGTSIDADYDSATSTLNLSNSDSIASYQQVLRTLTYGNSSDDPTTSASRLVDVTVTSDGFMSEAATATINVVAVNDGPDLLAIADQSIELNQTLTVPLTVVDPDSGDAITFFLDPDDTPATATIEPAQTSGRTAELRWTPTDADDVGNFTFRLLVTDDGVPAGVDQETFSVAVTPATSNLSVDLNGDEAGIDDVVTHNENDVTSVIANANLSIDSPEAEIDFVALSLLIRPDGGQERLEVTETAGINLVIDDEADFFAITLEGPATIEQFENALKSLSYMNTSDTPATDVRRIQIVAFDGEIPSNPAFINLSVIPENDAPSIMSIDDQNAVVGEELTVALTATDPEGDSISFQKQSGPDSATVQPGDAGAATFSWTPTTADADTSVTFEIVVTDDGDPALTSDPESFLVTVSPAVAADDNTIAGATLVPLATGATTTILNRIDPTGDVDMYAFDVQAGQVLAAKPGDIIAPPIVGQFKALFFRENGTPIASTTDDGETFFVVAESAGRIFVGISAPNNSNYDPVNGSEPVGQPAVGDYDVEFSLDVITPAMAAAFASPKIGSRSQSIADAAAIDEAFAADIGSMLLDYRV